MHIFAFCCLTFIIGCFYGIKIPAEDLVAGIILFGVIFIMKVIFYKLKSLGNLYVVGILPAFLIGAISGGLHHYNTFAQVTDMYGDNITITGRVLDVSDNKCVVSTEDYCVNVTISRGMRVSQDEVIEVEGKFEPIDSAQFNGDTDFRYYYALRGIVGRMYATKITTIGYNDKFSIWDIGTNVRDYVGKMVKKYSNSPKIEGLMVALLTGNTDKLDEGVRDSFRLTGISHLVAVSGLHMGIFLSFFLIISSRIRKNRILHFVFILLLVILYTIFIGERASVLRAGIMAVISYFVFGINRRNGGIMKLMLAGVIICIINPYYAVDVGFQLSFTVTLGMLLYTEFFRYKIVAVPFIAMVFVLPFSVYYFNTISLETVVVNLLTVPVIPAVVLFGYIGCIIPFFGYMAGILSLIVISVAEFFAKFDWLHITVPSPGAWDFVVFYLICCGVYFLLDNRKIGKMFLMFLLASVISVNMYAYRSINGAQKSIKSVDDMIFVVTEGGYNIVINPGYKLQDYVIKQGVDEINLVVMTDNKYEYLKEASNNCNINTILVPESSKNKNLQLENYSVLYYNQDDYEFNIDGVGFEFKLVDNDRYLMIDFYNKNINIPLPVSDNSVVNTNTYNIFGIMPVY